MLRRQAMLNWLHESKSSMFVYWRLMLRRTIGIVEVDPSLVAPKAIVMAAVMLVVHANLRHHRLVHALEESSGLMYSLCKSNGNAIEGLCVSWTTTVFLAKAVFKNGRLHA